mmetsp:Transcript_35338/g.69732  ORF Transcript_35338/g.69732 Transcript_35338/m.69732 type:complete len:135 (-) Transcript_35338:239-643(-)
MGIGVPVAVSGPAFFSSFVTQQGETRQEDSAFDAQSGTAQSVAYNECVRHLVVQMTSGMLRRPPGGFEGLVRSFFRRRHALVCGRLVQAQEKRGSKKRKHDSGGVVRYFLLGATETMDPDADEKLIRDLNELLL